LCLANASSFANAASLATRILLARSLANTLIVIDLTALYCLP